MPVTIPLITLLTDFGDRDYFVASVKGVILNINPQAHIVDLSHHVTPHDVADAAYLLKSCYRYFPDGTIHVAVVDPGVGTTRRPRWSRPLATFLSARTTACSPTSIRKKRVLKSGTSKTGNTGSIPKAPPSTGVISSPRRQPG